MIALCHRLRHILPNVLPFSFVLLLTACQFPGMIPSGQPLPPAAATPSATPLAALRLPQDEGPHNDLTEWWYYTGHLSGQDATGHTHQYGFELTFFQNLRGNLAPIYVGDYAITDITANQYHTSSRTVSEQLVAPPTGTTTSGFNLAIGDWTMSGLSGHDHLQATMSDYTMTLALDSEKASPALHNTDGIIPLGSLGTTYYYSRTRMAVSGSFLDHGAKVTVTGLAWMDHQWGNFLPLAATWDWYSIQLANNTEYMVFFLDTHQAPSQRITLASRINPDGSVDTVKVIAEMNLGGWTSPTTHITYPSGWQIFLGDGQFTITPVMVNQEFIAQDGVTQPYWEGAGTVKAMIGGHEVDGQAYTELTGYTKQS